MVYGVAYDSNKKVVSYLVTSDYNYSQKDWVPADTIDFISAEYAYVTMSTTANCYTYVNSVTEDTDATKISGLYNNSYVPILEKKEVSGQLWYKVPVSLSSNNNSYGWTLSKTEDATFTLYTVTVENTIPEIKAVDKTIVQGTKIDLLKDVEAIDKEDGKVEVKVKNSKAVVTVPMEKSTTVDEIIELASENGGWIGYSICNQKKNMTKIQFEDAINRLMSHQVAWADEQNFITKNTKNDDVIYWFPGIIKN